MTFKQLNYISLYNPFQLLNQIPLNLIKLYSFYNHKETSYFNLYKCCSLARIVA